MSKSINKSKVIKKLLQLGVSPAEIAELLDASVGYVHSLKSKIKYEIMISNSKMQDVQIEAHLENISRAIDKINSPSLGARLKRLLLGKTS